MDQGLSEGTAVALVLEGMAAVAAVEGEAERAATLLGAAEVRRQAARSPLPPAERDDVDQAEARARALLGDSAFALAVQRGRALSLEEALALAR